jgi:pleiotropic regulator 1
MAAFAGGHRFGLLDASARSGSADGLLSLDEQIRRGLKRTHTMYLANYGQRPEVHEAGASLHMNLKLSAEYGLVKDMPNVPASAGQQVVTAAGGAAAAAGAGAAAAAGASAPLMLQDRSAAPAAKQTAAERLAGAPSTAVVAAAGASASKGTHIMPRRNLQRDMPKPEWHAPWKMMRVISGHLGWVRAIAVDPTNDWFVTGSADRTIKVWDLASGTLRLTLTGHIGTVRGLAISSRSPYLFSAGEDKMVKCWDLEYNKVIRHYHGHLSGVYSLSLHPTLDFLVTGGRDSVARVWDIRTKNNVHTLTGHNQTVVGLATQALEPQIISGSMDSTVRLWDLVAGRASAVLTNHKKAVRAIGLSPNDYTFVSARHARPDACGHTRPHAGTRWRTPTHAGAWHARTRRAQHAPCRAPHHDAAARMRA